MFAALRKSLNLSPNVSIMLSLFSIITQHYLFGKLKTAISKAMFIIVLCIDILLY